MADAHHAQALGEAELHEMVHRRVAGSGAEDAAVAGDRFPGDRREDGALAGARRTVDAEEVAGGESALDREALLRVQRIEPLGRLLRLEARRLLAEEDIAATAGRA